jgi:uncharacterized protein (TIGR03083 family)
MCAGFGSPGHGSLSCHVIYDRQVGIAHDIVVENHGIADTLQTVGPHAPAGVGHWTAQDLAAHLHSQTMGRGVVVFVGRSMVARGVRIPAWPGYDTAAERTIGLYRRRGFEAALRRLRAGVPRLLLRPSVAPVTLCEVWLHHDDVRRANGLEAPPVPDTLNQAVSFALRYQRSVLGGSHVDRSVPPGDLLRWLSGRPSPLPSHDPPLRF